jgi:hypothetical protein
MELTLSTFASWLSAFAFQFIDRSSDNVLIGKRRLDKLPDLIIQSFKGLPKLTEFSSFCITLYAHFYISIQIITQNARKK